jgi:fumarate reductase flavoprotein subunit
MDKTADDGLSGESSDVLVIGCGGSGIAAALTVAHGGARVTVFEKRPFAGGSTNYVEGTYGAESEMQRRGNVRAGRDEEFRQQMDYSHWRANGPLVRAVVDKSGDTISWLERSGVQFSGLSADYPGGPMVWHLFKGFGAAAMKALVAEAVSKGVRIRYEATAKRLLRDGAGPVKGVIVEEKDGSQSKVEAKAVIVASGGFSNNKEWIRKYTGFDLDVNLFSVGYHHKIGEGIQMAWEAGAAEEGIGVILFNVGMPPRTIKPQGHMLGAVGQPTLWINRHGVRFCDETVIENMIHAGNVMSRQPGGYVFRIFDEETKNHLVEHGGLGVGNYCPPATPLRTLDREIETAIGEKSPYVFVAGTLGELAAKMHVDGPTFKETVDTYNGFCAKGHDDLFAKEPAHLRQVKSPRFYAFKCYTDFLCTLGGIRINEKTEVLDTEGNVIPGLYAAGCDAGGMYGDSYDIIASGIGSAFAFNSGRIAGENALIYTR